MEALGIVLVFLSGALAGSTLGYNRGRRASPNYLYGLGKRAGYDAGYADGRRNGEGWDAGQRNPAAKPYGERLTPE